MSFENAVLPWQLLLMEIGNAVLPGPLSMAECGTCRFTWHLYDMLVGIRIMAHRVRGLFGVPEDVTQMDSYVTIHIV